ncbi:MAG: nucleotidyltransferase family protein [Thermoanaerobaculia bacterium]
MTGTIEPHIDALRPRIREIARRHGATSVRLFGSFARGEESETSDVDLLVEMEAGRSLVDLIALQHELEALLGRDVDIATTRSLSSYIRESVEGEALEL